MKEMSVLVVKAGGRKNSCGNLFKLKAKSSQPECTFFLTLFYLCWGGGGKVGEGRNPEVSLLFLQDE